MDQEEIRKLEYWINDAYKIMKQDRQQHCTENNIDYKDYYPFIAGQLKAHIEILKEIIEGR